MAEQYTIVSIEGFRSFASSYGPLKAWNLKCSGPGGVVEQGELNSKPEKVLVVGEVFWGERSVDPKYGVKWKRVAAPPDGSTPATVGNSHSRSVVSYNMAQLYAAKLIKDFALDDVPNARVVLAGHLLNAILDGKVGQPE